jgi:hypothetical protein
MIKGNGIINAVRLEVCNGQLHRASVRFPGKLLDILHYYIFMTSLKLGKNNLDKYRQKTIRKCQANDIENSFSIQL